MSPAFDQSPESAPESATVPITNDRAQIDAVREQIVEAVRRFGYPEASTFAIRLAVEEAISNAFRHGHRTLPDSALVRVEYTVDHDEVHVAVEDSGPGFNPSDVPDPTLDENIELASGRGLMLMRAYMTSVEFNDRGNQVKMRYDRPNDD
jgi:serine/threonine-protein kinase RsbW